MEWQPVETAPKGIKHLLYFPPDKRTMNGELIAVDYYPVRYPRKPTHWIPLPPTPKEEVG